MMWCGATSGLRKIFLVCFIVAAVVVSGIVYADDASLVFHFDEGTGTVVHDSSGHGNDGTIYDATWTDGISAKSLSFDGMKGAVIVPDSNSLRPQQFTISTWVKPRVHRNEINGYLPIVSKWSHSSTNPVDGFSLFYGPLGIMYEVGYGGTGSGAGFSTDLPVNTWSHIVLTYDGPNCVIYINGQPRNVGGGTKPISYTSEDLMIGKKSVYTCPIQICPIQDYYFNGDIDEVYLFPRILDYSEVQSLYANPGFSNIYIKTPNGGESWPQGSVQTIQWDYSRDWGGSTVTIELLKGGILDSVITASTPIGSSGSGSYSWTVPANQVIGSDYKVRISSISNSGTTIFTSNRSAESFAITEMAGKFKVREIIIETRTLDPNNLDLDLQKLFQFAKSANVEGISIAFKDDGDLDIENSGKLYYSSTVGDTLPYYSDSHILDEVIQQAHENNIRVYAWVPIFNDKVFGDNMSAKGLDIWMTDRDSRPLDKFVNPVNDTVRSHELAIIEDIAQQYDKESESDLVYIDGFRLDWCRFDGDWQDWNEDSLRKFREQYPMDNPDTLTPHSTPWNNWTAWRAEQISSFISSANQNIKTINPDYEVGVYLLPFSVQTSEGYNGNTAFGQNYTLISGTGVDIMPMVYWQDWPEGPISMQWTADVIHNSVSFSRPPSHVIPVFSVTTWISKLKQYITEGAAKKYLSESFDFTKNNGIPEVSLFYFDKWQEQQYDIVLDLMYSPASGSDIGVVRFGQWILDYGIDGSVNRRFQYGQPTDTPIVGDFNNDGTTDIGVFRYGQWVLDYGRDRIVDRRFNYGLATDKPVVGDFNNDGTTDTGVFRSGQWILDYGMDGTVNLRFNYGLATDKPVVGDFNNDGITDIGVFRSGQWILDYGMDRTVDRRFNYGLPTDIPLAGDFNNDGITDTGVFRFGQWILDYGMDRIVDYRVNFGLPTDIPIVGIWV